MTNNNRFFAFLKRIFEYRGNVLIKLLPIFYVFCAWFELELTQGYTSKSQIFRMDIKYILLNALTLWVLYVFLLFITNRYAVAGLVFHIIVLVIALVNYYAVAWRGLPLTIHEIANFKTAMNVIGLYTITIDRYVCVILISFLLNFLLCCISYRFEQKRSRKKNRIRNVIMAVAAVLVMYVGYFSANPIKPRTTITWTWEEAYRTYGYAACTVESIVQSFHIYNIPEGYSKEAVAEIEVGKEAADTQRPDIILILNETFYDPAIIAEIETDIPYLENFYQMENVIRGYAVVPFSGGGTNNSEYELLTSNSFHLFNGNITPFNVFDMKDSNSIVSYLNQLGYHTIGAHAASSVNYNRERVYPNMGFDAVYFIEDFENVEYYGQRELAKDRSMYENLYTWYEDNAGSSPVFSYLLTIQNHGGWETNAEEEDTVHVLKDYGELTGSINEFLSCIRLADIALAELIDYFEQVDRPVIICMMGDHAPWFVSDIADPSLSDRQKEVLERSTPFMIWANYDIEDQDVGYMSLNYIVPTLLEVGEVDMSPYYQYMSDLKEKVPVMTSCGYYLDADGNSFSYEEESAYTEEIQKYFYMEYNNLQSDRRQELFE